MNSTSPVLGTENQSLYQIDSRKEIILLLHSLQEEKQPINLIVNEGNEVIITAILKIDDEDNAIIFDCPSTESASQHLIEAPRVYFEATLNKISIRFSSSSIIRCHFMGLPAFSCTIPSSLIRLQRREYYRINTPLAHPFTCTLSVSKENEGDTITLPLVDISCGGAAMLDEKRELNIEFGTLYNNCKINFPDIGIVVFTLQVRNSQNLVLLNHKTSRRIGFQFIDLSKSIMAKIQKLITKIERERNATR